MALTVWPWRMPFDESEGPDGELAHETTNAAAIANTARPAGVVTPADCCRRFDSGSARTAGHEGTRLPNYWRHWIEKTPVVICDSNDWDDPTLRTRTCT